MSMGQPDTRAENALQESEHPRNKVWHHALTSATFSDSITAETVSQRVSVELETAETILDTIEEFGWLKSTSDGYLRDVPEEVQ